MLTLMCCAFAFPIRGAPTDPPSLSQTARSSTRLLVRLGRKAALGLFPFPPGHLSSGVWPIARGPILDGGLSRMLTIHPCRRPFSPCTPAPPRAELSLPGAIQVNLAADFVPINETLGTGAQATVFVARAVGAGISTRLGCPDTVAIKQLKGASLCGDKGPAAGTRAQHMPPYWRPPAGEGKEDRIPCPSHIPQMTCL